MKELSLDKNFEEQYYWGLFLVVVEKEAER